MNQSTPVVDKGVKREIDGEINQTLENNNSYFQFFLKTLDKKKKKILESSSNLF